jgi:hypothetical protein
MGIIIFIAAGIVGGLLLLLARYAPVRRDGDQRPAIPLKSLREVAAELLTEFGCSVSVDALGDPRYLSATKREPLGVVRYVVLLSPAPPGGVVDQTTVLALAEDVKSERATVGMLITSGSVETAGLAGLDVELQLLDGARFRNLVAYMLPERVRLLDRYRGFTPTASSRKVLRHQPTA